MKPAICLALFVVTTIAARASAQPVSAPAFDAVVAADGSEKYRTVQEAIAASPPGVDAAHPWVIHIKPGTYREVVAAQHEKRFVTLLGDDPLTTTITYDLNANIAGPNGKPIGTFRTPTVLVDADDFTIESRPAVFRELHHRRVHRLHLRRGGGVLREM